MVNFDLSEVLENSDLSLSLSNIEELMSNISIQSGKYSTKVSDLTIGIKPNQGMAISSLQDNGITKNFIKNGIMDVMNNASSMLGKMYTDKF